MTQRHHNWDKIEREFLASDALSLRAFCEEHGISYDSARQQSMKRGWMEKRHRLHAADGEYEVETILKALDDGELSMEDLQRTKSRRAYVVLATQLDNSSLKPEHRARIAEKLIDFAPPEEARDPASPLIDEEVLETLAHCNRILGLRDTTIEDAMYHLPPPPGAGEGESQAAIAHKAEWRFLKGVETFLEWPQVQRRLSARTQKRVLAAVKECEPYAARGLMRYDPEEARELLAKAEAEDARFVREIRSRGEGATAR